MIKGVSTTDEAAPDIIIINIIRARINSHVFMLGKFWKFAKKQKSLLCAKK